MDVAMSDGQCAPAACAAPRAPAAVPLPPLFPARSSPRPRPVVGDAGPHRTAHAALPLHSRRPPLRRAVVALPRSLVPQPAQCARCCTAAAVRHRGLASADVGTARAKAKGRGTAEVGIDLFLERPVART